MAGVLLAARREGHGDGAGGGGYVRTATVDRNLRAAALALCQQQPLLLQGPSGEHSPALLPLLSMAAGCTIEARPMPCLGWGLVRSLSHVNLFIVMLKCDFVMFSPEDIIILLTHIMVSNV